MRSRDLKTMTHDELRIKLDQAQTDLEYFAQCFDNLSMGEFGPRQRERFRELRDSARASVSNIGY